MQHVTIYNEVKEITKFVVWKINGEPLPPPHLYKQMVVIDYARRCNISLFIETGTYLGDMVNGIKDKFESIYSIELGDHLFKSAQERFERYSHIKICHGDSALMLKGIVPSILEPTVFWLDAHYSEGITVLGKKVTPIVEEIKTILMHALWNDHVLLIDDARLFTGRSDYPSIDEIYSLVKSRGDKTFEVKNDIIRVI